MQVREEDFDKIKAAVEQMQRTPDQRLTISALAYQAGMSASRFTAIFKVITGTTVQHKFTEARMKHARNMLESSNNPIARIATKCGYKNESAFTRAFRKHTGITPMEYRRRAKG